MKEKTESLKEGAYMPIKKVDDQIERQIVVSWMSAGVSSAVATKLAIEEIDIIMYIDIDDQHRDSIRFVKDCEDWFGKQIIIIQSPFKSVENVCISKGYVNGVMGARCTGVLKKDERKKWEKEHEDYKITYIWGMDVSEKSRADLLVEHMPDVHHRFPLIQQRITKNDAHRILKASGIKRPVMYDLGYNNNNCIGCVKGGMGYWNKIREDFPDVFKARAVMERKIGGTCIKGVFLDELDPERGRMSPLILNDCGILCELIAI